jgi:hypothetical protein
MVLRRDKWHANKDITGNQSADRPLILHRPRHDRSQSKQNLLHNYEVKVNWIWLLTVAESSRSKTIYNRLESAKAVIRIN